MHLSRRQFLTVLGNGVIAGVAGRAPALSADAADFPRYGNLRLLHFTDCHAQLLPSWFREPGVNLGVGAAANRAPHLVGDSLLRRFDITDARFAHALTHLNFERAARKYGKVGGFAHLATLVKRLRAGAGGASLLLDGGDTWQGSGTAYWTRGRDMIGAANLLGVDVMTGHWEFTYQDSEVLDNIGRFNGDFVAHNVSLTEEGLFEDQPAHDTAAGHVFRPYTIKRAGGVRVAVIGQAFPYTPIANPSRFIPYWTFGIREEALQKLVRRVRDRERPDAVVLLSHNGMDVDLKLAARVAGIDAILGGHTHDGVPGAIEVSNAGGKTLVTNAGCNGKFLGVMDLDIRRGRVAGYRHRLLPVFSNLIKPDAEMNDYIAEVRKPYRKRLDEPLARSETLLYRRDNFEGTFDRLICDALCERLDAQIALSPGFRWGTTVLPGETIRMENVLDQTCMTYPETYITEMTGEQLKLVFEDVCDNLFNPDPYRQQGGDMVRAGGLHYTCDPLAGAGKRISGMRLDDGAPIAPNKRYKVAGWATVRSRSAGEPVWDVVAAYLRDRKTVAPSGRRPKILNMAGNQGAGA